jgi:hypothetical protein
MRQGFNYRNQFHWEDLMGRFIELKIKKFGGGYYRKTLKGQTNFCVQLSKNESTAFLTYYEDNSLRTNPIETMDKIRFLDQDEIIILKLLNGDYEQF